METAVLQWKHKDYFDYSIYEEDEVGKDIWYWNREMYCAFEYTHNKFYKFAALDFHGRILTVHYLEYQDRIFLPKAGTKFSTLEPIPVEQLTLTISLGDIRELTGRVKDIFKSLIEEVPPQPKPILNNEYDFRKRIGKDIWKSKKIDKNFGLDYLNNIPIVPLTP